MRTLLALILFAAAGLFGACPAAWAQQQERKLEDRILKPDKTLAFDTRQSSFGAMHGVESKPARSKEYLSGVSAFTPKEYNARTFYGGGKQAYMSNDTYGTAAANTSSKYEMTERGKQVPLKTVPVKDARDADKSVATRGVPDAGRSFLNKGRSQSRFDSEGGVPKGTTPIGYTGSLKPMSIDDVRELLNKNK